VNGRKKQQHALQKSLTEDPWNQTAREKGKTKAAQNNSKKGETIGCQNKGIKIINKTPGREEKRKEINVTDTRDSDKNTDGICGGRKNCGGGGVRPAGGDSINHWRPLAGWKRTTSPEL